MSKPQPTNVKEYIVRVPKHSRKRYHMMRFHNASGVDFKQWSSVKMERENNYKEYKSLDEDQPRFGAGSEFGREQREEARRKRFGINVKKYQSEKQPWLMSCKDKEVTTPGVPPKAVDRKFKGIREGGVSENVSWFVFLQAKDGAFEAYPVEEWYNFQAIKRYKALSAEEAEEEFERRDKIRNYFSVMGRNKTKQDDDDDDEDGKAKSSGANKKAMKDLKLSELDDWMSDSEGDDNDSGDENDEERKPAKKLKRKSKAKQGGKRKRKEDGGSGTDCEEESDEYDDGAEHEYVSEDSSDSDQENDEKVHKDLAGVEEGKALKKLLDSDDEEEEEKKKEDEKQENKSDEDKKIKKESSPDLSDSSDDDKPKDAKKSTVAPERNSDVLKRKLAENPDGLMPANKRAKHEPVSSVLLQSDKTDVAMFEDQIRRYLARKPMTTTEILQKLKSKKTGHTSEELVEVIAVMLKKINPQKQRVKGKMYLSLKTLNG